MSRTQSLSVPASIRSPARSPKRVARLFGDLKVRLKLMVLHNVFFLILAIGVYFALYPYLPDHAKTNLFIVLGAIYILAVLVLETTIMPLYVYRPLQLMLDADQATQHGDRDRELIDEAFIPGDEIGQIMRSRNATIMELRKREEDLEEALRKLEAQDRLVSLGLLSASVAHELNTPLTVLQGSIEKLTETTDDAATLERLARMLRVTQRIRRISESLVDFSRVRKQHMEPVPLRHLIDEAWTLVAIDKKAAPSRFANRVSADDVVHRQFRPTGAGLRQSAAQCAVRHPAVRRHRGAFPAPESQRAALDLGRGGRQRPRHPARRAARHFRGLRFHASGRQGHRPRTHRGRGHRSPARRHHRGVQPGGGRRLSRSDLAGVRRAAQRRRRTWQ